MKLHNASGESALSKQQALGRVLFLIMAVSLMRGRSLVKLNEMMSKR